MSNLDHWHHYLDSTSLVTTSIVVLLSSVFAYYGWNIFNYSRKNSIDLFYVEPETKEHDERNVGFGYGDNFARFIKEKIPSLYGPDSGFKAAWWLPGGNAQTMYSSLGNFSKIYPIIYERKYIQLADGGLLTLDVTPPFSTAPVEENENVVLIVHGLTGGSHEAYVRAALSELTLPKTSAGLGMRAVVMNSRGCNNSPVITPRLYGAGSSDDARSAILWACHTFPYARLFGLGFSLGANILTKYTGEESDSCPLSGLVSLANVWDFAVGSHHLERGTLINRYVYRNVLGDALRTLIHKHRHAFLSSPHSPIPDAILEDLFRRRRVSLKEYDEIVASRMFRCKNAMDYYEKIGSVKVMENIRVPVLAINSWDDPIISRECLPIDKVHQNPWIVLAVTHGGGHLGWFESDKKIEGGVGRWYAKPVRQFFSALIELGEPPRPKPRLEIDDDGFVHLEGREDVGFLEVTLDSDSLDYIASGMGESKLLGGF
ncbi:hypothetical protein ABKN59_001501 [Abortiporus biennis]